MRFDHVGVPTTEERENEMYVEETKVWVTDPEGHPMNIEFLRFEPDSPVTGPVREQQHVAFRVADLDEAVEGEDVRLGPFYATDSLRVVFFLRDGAVFEFMDHEDEGDWFEGDGE